MAIKRIVSDKVADDKTYQKLMRDLDFLPNGHRDRARIQLELNATKVRMANRRV